MVGTGLILFSLHFGGQAFATRNNGNVFCRALLNSIVPRAQLVWNRIRPVGQYIVFPESAFGFARVLAAENNSLQIEVLNLETRAYETRRIPWSRGLVFATDAEIKSLRDRHKLIFSLNKPDPLIVLIGPKFTPARVIHATPPGVGS